MSSSTDKRYQSMCATRSLPEESLVLLIPFDIMELRGLVDPKQHIKSAASATGLIPLISLFLSSHLTYSFRFSGVHCVAMCAVTLRPSSLTCGSTLAIRTTTTSR
jgi:hypothetical protein